MERLFVLLMLCAAFRLNAQDNCSCPQNLDRYIDLVTRNYSGFHDKVNDLTRTRYTVLVDSLRSEALATTDKSRCFVLLDSYRSFFWDKHLHLGGAFMPGTDPAEASDPLEVTTWNTGSLRDYFQDRDRELRLLEGLWSLEAYEVGIVFDTTAGIYQAIITRSGNANWKEGMVKFTCPEPTEMRTQVLYRRGDLGSFQTSATFMQDHLLMDGIGTWRRTFPAPRSPVDERAFELTYGSEVQWKMLNDSTLYIKLGSCQLANKAVIDSLVRTNKEELARIPNWIVDFRDNGGGSTDVFQSLLPYLYTKPFKEYGVSHWLSPDNTAALQAFLTENEKMMDRASARSVRALVKRGESHPNTWRIGGGETTRIKRHAMPRRIAILANAGTASSGEAFLEMARGMSGKSLIFGENTGGFMDYGDVMPHPLGCDGLVASIPTSRMNRIDHGFSYDKDGIAPDVRIPKEETDHIGFVQRYWSEH